MKTNIPIFRAKTIKQDYNEWEECQQLKKIAGIWYAIGFYDCKRAGQPKKREIRFLRQCKSNFGERSSNMGKLNIIEKIAHMLQLQGMKMTNDRMEELKS